MIIHSRDVDEGTTWVTLAMVTDVNGVSLTQSGVSSVALKVFDVTAQDNVDLYSGSQPVVGATIFNTPRTDYGWDQDATGYNLRFSIPESGLRVAQKGGRTYLADYTVNRADGTGPRRVQHYISVRSAVAV